MNSELCVKTEALAMDTETGEGPAATPAEGDEVQFSGSGRVTRTEGGNTYLEVTEVNGTPLGGPDMAGEGESPEALRADILKTTGEGY